jgi:hypothetical protein
MQVSAKKGSFNSNDPEPSMSITYSGSKGAEAVVRVALMVYFCQDGDVCLLDTTVIQIPIKCSEGSAEKSSERRNAKVKYAVRLPPPSARNFAV